MQEWKEVLLRTNGSYPSGLHSEEAARRHRLHGANELTGKEPDPLWKKYMDQVQHELGEDCHVTQELTMGVVLQFKEPLILLLLGSAVISLLMGQYDDALSITIVRARMTSNARQRQ